MALQKINLVIPDDLKVDVVFPGVVIVGPTDLDYNKCKNKPRLNGLDLEGDMTYSKYNIASLTALQAVEKVVNEKAATADVQNALNQVAKITTTLRNDLDDLGDQTANIESKIPENASSTNRLAVHSEIVTLRKLVDQKATTDDITVATSSLSNAIDTINSKISEVASDANKLVSKSEMDTAIANAGGGDVDLSKYLEKTGGTMSGQIEFTEVEKNGLKFPGNGYLKRVGAVSGGNLETNQIFNSTAGLKSMGYRVLTEGDTINASQTKGLIPTTQKGAANGVVPLNASGKIDSQYLPEQTALTTVSDEKYGIFADYALTHGIIDCPNGLIDFSSNTKEIEINPGILLQLAGADNQTLLASKQKYVVKEIGKVTLFLARTMSADGTLQIGFLEAAEVYWQEEEPNNGTDAYLAWYNPNIKKWKFKSDDTGNIWREAIAGPIANINAGQTGIISVNYYGYSVNDGRNCASLHDIENLQEQDTAMLDRLDALENHINVPEVQREDLPDASAAPRQFRQVVNSAGNKVLAYSDGDEWYEILKTRLT